MSGSRLHRRAGAAAVVVLAAAALIAAGTGNARPRSADTPAAVVSAVDTWESKARTVVDNETQFQKVLEALPRLITACSVAQARGPLARSITAGLSPMVNETHAAERGELALYRLAPRLTDRRDRNLYVNTLDWSGKQFDRLLELAGPLAKVASDIAGNDCTDAVGLARVDAATLQEIITTLDAGLDHLRTGWG